jgi:hypothetical protein
MRINGFSDESTFIRYAANVCNLQPSTPKEAIPFVVLSTLAGKTTEEFARFHTVIPFRRAITNYRPEVLFGSLSCPSMLRTSATRTRQKRIFFCTECAKEDLQFHGESYWRRDHQINGQVWCPKHRGALSFVSSQSDVLKPPHSFLTYADYLDDSIVDEAMVSPAVNRFLEIANGLALRKKSVPGVSAAIELRLEAEKQGLYVHGERMDARNLVSELIRSSYPGAWLAIVMPEILKKSNEKMYVPIDRLLNKKNEARSSTTYLLIAAALYESSDEATTKLMNCEQRPIDEISPEIRVKRFVLRKSRKVSGNQSLSLTMDKLVNEYAKAYGRYARIAKSLNLSPPETIRVLKMVGLPNLSQRGRTRLVFSAAYSLCIEGLSLAECSKKTNISMKELSTWDVTQNSMLVRALRLMFPEATKNALLSSAVN